MWCHNMLRRRLPLKTVSFFNYYQIRASHVKIVDLTKELRERRRRERENCHNDDDEVFVDVLSNGFKQSVEMNRKMRREVMHPVEETPKEVKPMFNIEPSCYTEAEKLLEQGQYSKAKKLLSNCIELHPKDSLFLAQRANCNVALGELDMALEDLNTAAKLLYDIGELNDFKKCFMLAQILYNRAVLNFNCHRMKNALEDYNNCIEILRKRIDESNYTTSGIRIEVLKLLIQSLNNRSYLLLNESADENPTNYQQIIEDLTTCIEMTNQIDNILIELAQIYYNRARAYHLDYQYTNAIEDYKQFLKFEKSSKSDVQPNLNVHYALSECYMTLDQYSEALTHITFCIENLEKEEINKKDPTYRNHCKRLSKSYMIRAMCNIYIIYSGALSKKEELIQKVINDFSKSVEYGRREMEPWISRALIYMFYEKNYEKAIFNFSVALSRFDNSPAGIHGKPSTFNHLPFNDKDILFLRAQCYERLDDITSSISDYLQIIEHLNKKDIKQDEIFRSNAYTYKLLQLLLQNQDGDANLITLPSSDKSKEQWLAILRTKIAVLILEQGKQAMERKQEYDFSKFINKAMQNLWVALHHDPNYIDALYYRSKLYIQLFIKKEELNLEHQDSIVFKEFYEKAIHDLSNLIKVDAGSFYTRYALYNRAVLNFKVRQYQLVLDDVTTCLKEESIPSDMKQQLLKMRSQALLRLHRYIDYLRDRFY